VIFDVYVLGGKGGDPVEALRAGPKRGELVIRRRWPGGPRTDLECFLLEPGTRNELLPALLNPIVIAMNSLGMTVEGTLGHQFRGTSKAKMEYSRERWLCKPPGAKAVLDTEKLSRRSAAKLNRALVNGFDPAHDDSPEHSYDGPLM
jgi:hypothetical protein